MKWTVVLETDGSIKKIHAGGVHGNVQRQFCIEAERFQEAEEMARQQAPIWAARFALAQNGGPRPTQHRAFKPKVPRCGTCKQPLTLAGRCLLCEDAGSLGVVQSRDNPQLLLLLEVQHAWQNAQNVGKFTAWLASRIAEVRSSR